MFFKRVILSFFYKEGQCWSPFLSVPNEAVLHPCASLKATLPLGPNSRTILHCHASMFLFTVTPQHLTVQCWAWCFLLSKSNETHIPSHCYIYVVLTCLYLIKINYHFLWDSQVVFNLWEVERLYTNISPIMVNLLDLSSCPGIFVIRWAYRNRHWFNLNLLTFIEKRPILEHVLHSPFHLCLLLCCIWRKNNFIYFQLIRRYSSLLSMSHAKS